MALVNAAMNFRFPQNAGKLFSSYTTGGLSCRAQVRGISERATGNRGLVDLITFVAKDCHQLIKSRHHRDTYIVVTTCNCGLNSAGSSYVDIVIYLQVTQIMTKYFNSLRSH
jgi:hypothetical protein